MAIKWTTPLRRAGIHVLPNIPNEIYFEIFDYLEPSEDISAAEYKATMCKLALVCRFFSAMCLPRAFKSLIYDGEFKGNSKDEPSHAPFSRALLKGTKQAGTLAPFVKKCTFRNWSNDSKLLKEVFDAFTSLHLRAITRFDNLETLHFSHVMMQPIHFKAISMIKRLKHLTLTRCTNVTIGTLPKKLFKELVSLDITSSRLDTSLVCDLGDAACTQSLRKLHTEHFPPALLEKRCQSIALEDLKFSTEASDFVSMGVLRNYPSLKKIAFFHSAAHRATNEWPPSVEEVECFACCVPSVLQRHSIKLLRVHVPPSVLLYSIAYFKGRCDWPTSESLHSISFDHGISHGFNIELRRQKTCVDKLFTTFPNAVHIQLSDLIEWRIDPQGRRDAPVWKPALPRGVNPDAVRQLLVDSDHPWSHVSDYDDFLASLYPPGDLPAVLRVL